MEVTLKHAQNNCWQHQPGKAISAPQLVSIIFFMALWGSSLLPCGAESLDLGKNINIQGGIITDFSQNHNSDADFMHYASDSGSDFASTVNESWFSLSGSLGKVNGMETTFEASFDFMGENDFQLVTAWIRMEKGNWYFLAGKAESLVATGETTLNYDGFYSAGGIQTGAKANQNQLQFGYKLKKHFTFAFSITDEPAQNGSIDEKQFSADRPAVEWALLYNFSWGNGKIAGHTGDMRLASDKHFYPGIIMVDITIPITESISWLFSRFRARAASQFFPIDILFDYVPLPEGDYHESSATGGLTELLFNNGTVQAWAGFGTFSLTPASITHLYRHRPEDALTENHRFSVGSRYNFSEHLQAGLEISRYRTTHLMDTEMSTIRGTSVQLQFSITF